MKRYVFECEFSAVAATPEEAWEMILEGELQERTPTPSRVEEVEEELSEELPIEGSESGNLGADGPDPNEK